MPHDELDEAERQPLLSSREPVGHFRVIAEKGVPVRERPQHNGERTGEILSAGTTFVAYDVVTLDQDKVEIHQETVPVDGVAFLFLGEDRGWIVNRNVVNSNMLVEAYLPPEQAGGIAGLRHRLRMAFSGNFYEMSILAIVILNAIIIGVEIDFHRTLPEYAWLTFNTCFTVIYVLELVSKLFAFGPSLYFASNWNRFDFLVTLITVVGDALLLWVYFSGAKSNQTIGVISAVAPLLRLMRLLRLAKAFKDLRTLMTAFLMSLGSLFWIAILTLLWFYMCACLTTVFIGNPTWLPDGSVPNAPELREKFKDIPLSMFALFEVMTLEGWNSVVRPFVAAKKVHFVAFFLIFIFMTAFFLLNLVTAVVVDHTLAAQDDGEEAKQAVSGDNLERSVKELEDDLLLRNKGSDYVEKSEILAWMKELKFRKKLEAIDWDEQALESAVTALDSNHDGKVSITRLGRFVALSAQSLDALALLRFQADVTQRLDRQAKMMQELMT